MRVRSINGKILITFLGSLSAGIIIIAMISTIFAASFSNYSADQASDFFIREGIEKMDRSAEQNAFIVNEYFNEYISQVRFLAEFAEDLFNGRIDANPRKSYYGDLTSTSNEELPPLEYSEKHQLLVSLEYSGWYKSHIDSVEEEVTSADYLTVNISSNLDYAWHVMFEQNPNFLWSYMGFANGIHRTYPYKDLSSWKTKEFTNARDGSKIIGYDPRIRGFYVDAERSGALVIPSPQEDPTLGILKISISHPVYYDNGTLIGVVGADVTIDVIESLIENVKYGDHGYAFIIDTESNVVFHRDIDRTVGVQNIWELEGISSDNTDFMRINENMINLNHGSGVFTSNREKWYVSYQPIESAGFSLAILVPESELLLPSNTIKQEIKKILFFQMLIFFVIVSIFSGLIMLFVRYISKIVVKPITELTEVTEMISRGNLSSDISSIGGSKEINLLYTNFRGLVTALRFGNENYYAGNLEKAMQNYLHALEMFETLGNEKGQGICFNNIGNIHRARGLLKEANHSYRESIHIAERLLEKAVNEERKQLIFALASRNNNLGLLYKEIEQFDRAIKYLNRALEYDKMIDNSRGFATRYGNLGTVYLKMGKFDDAKSVFDEAFDIAEFLQSDRAIAHATINYGHYFRAIGNNDEAIAKYLDAIDLGEDLDVRIVIASLQNLKELYTEMGNSELADKVDKKLVKQSKKSIKKEISFVIDYSGSMSGRRIKSAVNGMRNIFDNQVNDDDFVSIIKFSDITSFVVRPLRKDESKDIFQSAFRRLNRPSGATAFYDALGLSIKEFIERPTSIDQFIVALTDGDDNSSKEYNIAKLESMIKETKGVNLIIIGVGQLSNKKVFVELCNLTPKGKYIDVEDGVADTITAAFEEVSSMLVEVSVEGFVPDY
ncbi:MAG: tetratricopeptide repeat protein [Candidatus Heimdallarchaeota archaeon]|nr:tetratricopeptide repeat protein [Candidatus Heimdallarchaeota archaeon]